MENELTSIVDALPDIVLTALPDGSVDFLNHRWYVCTAISDDNAFGHGWRGAIHPADPTELLDRCRAVLASGERGDMQARMRRFDGEYRQFLLSVRPIPSHPGTLSHGAE